MNAIKFLADKGVFQRIHLDTLDTDYSGDKKVYEEINEHIECDTMTLLAEFEGIDLFVDDNGMFSPNFVYHLQNEQEPDLTELYPIGNIVFVGGNNKTGETVPLTDEQVQYIRDNIVLELFGKTNVEE